MPPRPQDSLSGMFPSNIAAQQYSSGGSRSSGTRQGAPRVRVARAGAGAQHDAEDSFAGRITNVPPSFELRHEWNLCLSPLGIWDWGLFSPRVFKVNGKWHWLMVFIGQDCNSSTVKEQAASLCSIVSVCHLPRLLTALVKGCQQEVDVHALAAAAGGACTPHCILVDGATVAVPLTMAPCITFSVSSSHAFLIIRSLESIVALSERCYVGVVRVHMPEVCDKDEERKIRELLAQLHCGLGIVFPGARLPKQPEQPERPEECSGESNCTPAKKSKKAK